MFQLLPYNKLVAVLLVVGLVSAVATRGVTASNNILGVSLNGVLVIAVLTGVFVGYISTWVYTFLALASAVTRQWKQLQWSVTWVLVLFMFFQLMSYLQPELFVLFSQQ